MDSQRPGRPENPVDMSVPELGRFAVQLRDLRHGAGFSLRELARRTHFSTSVLHAATTGRKPPAEDVARAWVVACLPPGPGKEEPWEQVWRARYQRAARAYRGDAAGGSDHGDAVAGMQRAVRTSPGPTAPSAGWSPPASLVDALSLAYSSPRAWAFEDAPWRIPVRWSATADHLMAGLGDLPLAGQGPEIAEVYAAVPSGRLVIMGEPGSGTSELALSLARSVLASSAHRSESRVPMLLDLSAWQPDRVGLKDWIAQRLRSICPDTLAPASLDTPGDQARALVENNRILPILDGFHDLPDHLRMSALKAIVWELGALSPFVLTTRRQEYVQAIEQLGEVLPQTAAIRIEKLTIAELEEWLPVGRRPAASAKKWEPVLQTLAEPAGQRLAQMLREVLTTASMAAIARQLYSDTLADPQELLGYAAAPDWSEFTARLARHYLVLSYAPADWMRQGSSERGFGLYSASRALNALARQLRVRGSTGIRAVTLHWAFPPRVLAVVVTGALLLAFTTIGSVSGFFPQNMTLVIVSIVMVCAGVLHKPRAATGRARNAMGKNLTHYALLRSLPASLFAFFIAAIALPLLTVPDAAAAGSAAGGGHTGSGGGSPLLSDAATCVVAVLCGLRVAANRLAYLQAQDSATAMMKQQREISRVLASAGAAFSLVGLLPFGVAYAFGGAMATAIFLFSTGIPGRWFLARACSLGTLPDLPRFTDDACRRGVMSRQGDIYRIRYPVFAPLLTEKSFLKQIEPPRQSEPADDSAVRQRWPVTDQ